MPQPSGAAKSAPPPVYAPWPAFLSYLVPGLGQIYQGRVAKGVLFMVCIYALFFYGMALGDFKNVYLGDTAAENNPLNLSTRLLANLYNRPQFLGQFWVGVAVWPAILQYNRYDRANPERKDAVFGEFEKQPTEAELNKLQVQSDKTWDLAWVYTVIAGALNVLVIYDALAGPALVAVAEAKRTPREVPAT